MNMLSLLSLLLLGLAAVLVLANHEEEFCSRTPPLHKTDCSTTEVSCVLYTSDSPNGKVVEDGCIPIPNPNTRSWYRTCFDPNGTCRATEIIDIQNLELDEYEVELSTVRKIFSPNWYTLNPNYVKSSISRYNVQCTGGRQLYYSYYYHDLEESGDCDDGPNTCLDFLKLTFPSYDATSITCGTLSDLDSLFEMDGNSMDAEIVTNRDIEESGVLMYVYCIDPAFDINASSQQGRRKRNVERCTSPNGIGPRDEPFDPPMAKRIRKILHRNSSALFTLLEVGETLTYINNTVTVSNGAVFMDIEKLTVENRIQTKSISGSSTGEYGGFAQLVVSFKIAVLVQFGVRPIYKPTKEEAIAIGMLESRITETLNFDGGSGFDAEDKLDIFPRYNIQPQISKRGVDSSFLDEAAIEYGNACNGALRSAACFYQSIIMHRNCSTGLRIDSPI